MTESTKFNLVCSNPMIYVQFLSNNNFHISGCYIIAQVIFHVASYFETKYFMINYWLLLLPDIWANTLLTVFVDRPLNLIKLLYLANSKENYRVTVLEPHAKTILSATAFSMKIWLCKQKCFTMIFPIDFCHPIWWSHVWTK